MASPELLERLANDTPFWARHCAKIVDKRAQLVPLEANGPQKRFDDALEAQRAAGQPMRAIVLKSRKLGFSTWVQAKIIQRVTQRRYRKALVVGQDSETAGELFQMGERIWANLPVDAELGLKPDRTNYRRDREMHFGEPSRLKRDQGFMGLNSSLEVDTANEVEAGRGFTYTELHCSEVAFWRDVRKLTALLNAVPDEPETLIVLESTANGSNHFKTRWERAMAGDSLYVPIFAAWHEDPGNVLPFATDEDREEFIANLGEGEWGEDEPRLVEEFGCTPEQLHWRRQTIVDKTEANLDLFKQEYPASPEEAFLASGKQVFSMALVSKVLDRTRQTDPQITYPDNPGPDLGVLKAGKTTMRKTRSGLIEVPLEAKWTPAADTGLGSRHPFWRVWEEPDPGYQTPSNETPDPDKPDRPPGKYVVSVDPAGGEENDEGELANHAIEVINHRTREQVAELATRNMDPDQIGEQAYLAALHWNRAWLCAERTGGYGLFMLRRWSRDFAYAFVYKSRSLDKTKEKHDDRLGWDSTRVSKVILEDGAREMLREGTHGIRSRFLASEMTTYVRNEKGKTGPDGSAFADRLMAWMIAQQVAQETVIPPERKKTRTTSAGRIPRDPVTGW